MHIDVSTEQLRALVAIVDFRSFTKAAQHLRLSQPAVSAQIKRIQEILGSELLDKSAPGVKLTAAGELVVGYARRILALNDQLVQQIKPVPPVQALRIGVPGDFVDALLPAALAGFRAHSPNSRFHIRSDISENLLNDLRQGELDLAVALTLSEPAPGARPYWLEEAVWIRGPSLTLDPAQPVPLVTYTDSCVYTRLATSVLSQAGRDHEIVFTGTSVASLTTAVGAGLGVMVLARRVVPPDLAAWDDAPLPRLPDLVCGIYLRDGDDRNLLGRLAQELAGIIKLPAQQAS